jgi:hypothetical protein
MELNAYIKKYKGFGKGAPGRVREGDGILVR